MASKFLPYSIHRNVVFVSRLRDKRNKNRWDRSITGSHNTLRSCSLHRVSIIHQLHYREQKRTSSNAAAACKAAASLSNLTVVRGPTSPTFFNFSRFTSLICFLHLATRYFSALSCDHSNPIQNLRRRMPRG